MGLRSRRAALLALAIGALSPSASAHYGFPRAFSIVFGPGGTDRVLLRSDVWGIVRSWDKGQSWQWSCAEVYAGISSQAEYHPMLITNTGRILVGSNSEGLRASDDFCNWRRIDGLGDAQVADVEPSSGNDLVALTSTRNDGGLFNTLLWKSTDDGESWARTGTPMQTHFIGAQLKVAPSDSKRVYVVGIEPDGKVGLVQRSEDGGASWTEHQFAFDTNPNGSQYGTYFRLPMVHPTRPDVAFIHVDMGEDQGKDSPDSILGTKDGGLTWRTLFDSKGDLPGIAVSPDGNTLLIAGPLEGVQSANLDDALLRGQAAFQRVFDGMVWGLNWLSDGTLYAGNNNFGATGVPEITLGVSHDGGHSFEKAMNICDIGFPRSCGAGTTLGDRCQPLWNTPPAGFAYDFVYGERCATADAGAGADGGINATGGKPEGDCNCTAPGRSDSGSGAPVAAAFTALAVAVARWRRRISRARP